MLLTNFTSSGGVSSSGGGGSLGGNFLSVMESAYNSKIFLVIRIVIAVYCAILLFNIIYTSLKLSLFRGKARQLVTGTKAKAEQYVSLEDMPTASVIMEINKKIISSSSSDWKIAIVEGDKILDKTLEFKGFQGASLGEKLKQMVPAELPDLYEEVWEAHKIRNRIVHEPDFEISQNEARKVVGIYERALKKLA